MHSTRADAPADAQRLERFTYDDARLGGLLHGLAVVLAVDTVAMLAFLLPRHPRAALLVTALNVAGVAWLYWDDRALATRPIELGPEGLLVRFGARWTAEVPLASVERVEAADWRTKEPRGLRYVRATAIGDPNVILHLREPVRVRLGLGMHQTVRAIGLRVDEPAAFVAAVERRRAALAGGRADAARLGAG